MKFSISLRTVSGLALLAAVPSASLAFAQTPEPQTVTTSSGAEGPQQTPAERPLSANTEDAPSDRVVVTGSLIRTAPEDAPKPVEVFTMDDLTAQGQPSTSEFVRSLTGSYGSDFGFGQAVPDCPSCSGFANADLRGLGSSGTLVLQNGRRVAPWNGSFGADINGIPMEALAAVEVLKDGASSTYGAGAVGGVINFTTRRDINAPQLTVERTMYDGGKGAYKVDFLTGWSGDSSNLLISLSSSHEDAMSMTKRSFSSLPFNINPAPYTLTGSNPGMYQIVQNFLTTPGPLLASFPGTVDLRNASDCTAIGGQIANVMQPGANIVSVAPNTNCAFPQYAFADLVSENDTNRIYLEFNADISDSMEFHFDAKYNTSQTYQGAIPSNPASNTAIDRSQQSAANPLGFISNTCFQCNYVVPVSVSTYTAAATGGVPTTASFVNPFIADFRARTGLTATTLPNTAALYMGGNWRPFLFGGHPLDGRLKQNKYERDGWIFNAGVKGEFTGDGFLGRWLNGVTYDYNAQYNQYLNTWADGVGSDLFASRLQNALLGYGGPSCNAIDRVPTDYSSNAAFNRTVGIQSDTAPGTNGCQWFNPFASAFPTSAVTGTANPQFNSGAPNLAPGSTARPTGYANPTDLMDWLIGNRIAEYKLESFTYDALFTGSLGKSLELPGGEIGWALGSQWRQVEGRSTTRDDNRDEQNAADQQCVWPAPGVTNIPAQPNQAVGQRGCPGIQSAFYGEGRVSIVGTIPPFYYDTQTLAFFGELQLPVLDDLNFTASYRREDYNSGSLVGEIWSVAGKYQFFEDFYIRGSVGTNYRADGALELDPGAQNPFTTTPTRFGSALTINGVTTVASGIGPEDDRTMNIGAGYEGDWGDLKLRASVDFWEIVINGQLATTNQDTILLNVFGPNTGATANSVNQAANCSAALISFVQFNAPCVQGVTIARDLAQINLFQLNGPSFITNGVDYAFDATYPVFDGSLAFQLNVTQNLVYKAKGYFANGILFDAGGDRLGFGNFSRTGALSEEWKGNATLRWRNNRHTVSLRANFSSGTEAELDSRNARRPIIDNPGATPDVFSEYGQAAESYRDVDLTYIYKAPWFEELEVRASILNLTDQDPPAAQGRSGYYNGIGNPRGRIFKLAATKKF